MKTSPQASTRPLRGIAALLDDSERKELFRKYVYFLGWVELLILVVCWLYQLGDRGSDRFGPVEIPFPWKLYFLISFLAPIAITFLIGLVIVGFNKYFAEPQTTEESVFETEGMGSSEEGHGRTYQLKKLVLWLQRLPFLALLLLLGVAAGLLYKLDVFMTFLANMGDRPLKMILISAAILLAVVSIFAFLLILLNYQLRKRSMDYQYKSEVAERFGLIILDDNTVLNSQGRLLIQGNKGKKLLPVLPSEPVGPEPADSTSSLPPHTAELKTS